MSVQIIGALSDGVGKVATREGFILLSLFYVLSAVSGVINALLLPGSPSTVETSTGPIPAAGTQPSFESLLPALSAALALSLLIGLISVILTIGALRIFVTGESLSSEVFTRNLPLVFINYTLGGIIYTIIVGLGLIFLIIPGIFFMITLVFWTIFVAVEDENFVSAFGDSWRLTKGSRLQLFGLGLVVTVVGVPISAPFGLVSSGVVLLAGGGTAAQVVSSLIGPIGSVITTMVTLGTLAAAYHQLTPDNGMQTSAMSDSGRI